LEKSLSQEQLRDDERVSKAGIPIGSTKPIRVEDKAAERVMSRLCEKT
jgi:hypothetical protein